MSEDVARTSSASPYRELGEVFCEASHLIVRQQLRDDRESLLLDIFR
jgi:chaperonin cofactor prefoldin